MENRKTKVEELSYGTKAELKWLENIGKTANSRKENDYLMDINGNILSQTDLWRKYAATLRYKRHDWGIDVGTIKSFLRTKGIKV